jgi:hypothetical protein
MYRITPINETIQVTKVSIEMQGFQLNATSGQAVVIMYDNNDHCINTQIVDIPEAIYKQWGTDDNYIIDYVLSQIPATRSLAQ